jgi:uncharacterized repeat protein (TIGR01451 family)
MSRFAMIVIAGTMVVGSVVALLPAQDARRAASSYEAPPELFVPAPAEPAGFPPTVPLAELTPIVLPPNQLPRGAVPPAEDPTANNLYRQFSASSQQASQDRGDPILPSANEPSTPGTLPIPQAPAAVSPSRAVSPPAQVAQILAAAPPSNNYQLATVTGADIAAPGESAAQDDSQLHSVLKRGRPPATTELPSPADTLARPGSATALPRRSPPPLAPLAPRTGAATPEPVRSQARLPAELAITGKSPALRVEVAGPQGITVGKPAAYVVTLVNEGEIAADEVQLRLSLPGWVTVSGSQPTSGEAALQNDAQGAGRLVWSVPRVAKGGRKQLRLQLVTTEPEAFDLGVEWTCRPTSAKAAVLVKQPKLELSLAGPADITFGEEKIFTLSVSNPGTGDADRVVVAVASGTGPSQQVEVGGIPAGHKKELPLAVVAGQPGEMELRASATAEGGLTAQTSGKIIVRKAEVSVAIEGPPLKFAGTEATYVVTVTNSGSAAADNVNLSLALPPGARYIGGIDGGTAASGGLKWKIATLAAGAERTYEVRVQLQSAGLNRLVVQSQASASGASTAQAETTVEAVSDLKLIVNDPAGPLPLTEQAVYEVQVTNRGSQAAQRVRIIMQFAEGIEPVSFEGCEARLVPGQVVCQPLVQLGAGEQVTLRVKAKGQQAGTHQFRVEVTTAAGDARLVSEGTTRFFAESGRATSATSTAKKPTLVPGDTTPNTLKR